MQLMIASNLRNGVKFVATNDPKMGAARPPMGPLAPGLEARNPSGGPPRPLMGKMHFSVPPRADGAPIPGVHADKTEGAGTVTGTISQVGGQGRRATPISVVCIPLSVAISWPPLVELERIASCLLNHVSVSISFRSVDALSRASVALKVLSRHLCASEPPEMAPMLTPRTCTYSQIGRTPKKRVSSPGVASWSNFTQEDFANKRKRKRRAASPVAGAQTLAPPVRANEP